MRRLRGNVRAKMHLACQHFTSVCLHRCAKARSKAHCTAYVMAMGGSCCIHSHPVTICVINQLTSSKTIAVCKQQHLQLVQLCITQMRTVTAIQRESLQQRLLLSLLLHTQVALAITCTAQNIALRHGTETIIRHIRESHCAMPEGNVLISAGDSECDSDAADRPLLLNAVRSTKWLHLHCTPTLQRTWMTAQQHHRVYTRACTLQGLPRRRCWAVIRVGGCRAGTAELCRASARGRTKRCPQRYVVTGFASVLHVHIHDAIVVGPG